MLPKKEESRSEADEGKREGKREEEGKVVEREDEVDRDENEVAVIMKYGDI